MTLAQHPDTEQPDYAIHDASRLEGPRKFKSAERPPKMGGMKFVYKTSVVPIDSQTLLRLTEQPVVMVDSNRSECEVLGWNIRVHPTQIGDIDRLLARRFVFLQSKASENRLNNEERMQWLGVLDQVDYQAYCLDREEPRYVEGEVISTSPKYRIQWHDGESAENIPSCAAVALRILNRGDRFGAYVKWDRLNKPCQIERVRLLTDEWTA